MQGVRHSFRIVPYITYLAMLVFLLSRINQYFPILIKARAINLSSTPITLVEPRVKIVFLKTHKTGSSTVSNILQRFGLNHKLGFALPQKKTTEERSNYIGGFGATLSESELMPLKKGKTYEILTCHVIYNKKAFDKVFRGKTFYFTILREPWQQFVSAINYYGLADGYINNFLSRNVSNPLSEYLAFPKKFEPSDAFLSFTDNRQLFDLGYSFSTYDPRNSSQVNSYVRNLVSELDFVMLTEYFDESLILLRRKLNLKLKDIVYIPQNTRRINKTFALNKIDRKNFRKWYTGDLVLYNTFKEILLKQMKETDNLNIEVQHFQKVKKSVISFCSSATTKKSFTVGASKWNIDMVFTPYDCSLLCLDEISFLNKLRGIVYGSASVA